MEENLNQKNQEEKKRSIFSKIKWLDIILLAVFVFLIWLVFSMSSQGNACMTNPFVYGAQEITDEDNDLVCSCSFTDMRYARFQFNKERINHEGTEGLMGGQVSGKLFEEDPIEEWKNPKP